ncbi:MAG: LytTR family transcriptional regulator [Eubacterium sp.]|nr:LytTR family transcriptional regulator [Eubacterium sp.]
MKKTRFDIDWKRGETIKAEEIVFIEAQGKYTQVFSSRGSFFSDCMLAVWEKKLENDEFIRCHRGYLVNRRYIVRIHDKEIELKNGARIRISRRLRKETMKRYREYILNEA